MSTALNTTFADVTAHVVRALTLYSLAEVQTGHASVIVIEVDGPRFSITDNGRGHAIDRTVAGVPYMQLVYTHLQYPFGAAPGCQIQLQGIGISLINALCSELTVVVQKRDCEARLIYHHGYLSSEECVQIEAGSTGNSISGRVRDELQPLATDLPAIEAWLGTIVGSTPGLELHFNGRSLPASTSNAA
ncbi:MAG: hypothetical protein KGN16_13870 [Burkholderiales bacterium]|nr:hypothetical protein [Burkholderiales bacterium]